MNTLESIMNRRSVRKFSNQDICDADIHTILEAGMSGPSCVNARDWSFIVVKNPDTLNKMADANGSPAAPLRGARLGILICGDLSRAFPPAKDYWVVDGSIAAQNMILAAQSLGIGSVWLGTWPQMDRVRKQADLFGLPENQVPHSIIAFGYPAEAEIKERDVWEADRVHYEQW
ncbi:MAG: nitroreductase family protein [Brotaphodocola sp.]